MRLVLDNSHFLLVLTYFSWYMESSNQISSLTKLTITITKCFEQQNTISRTVDRLDPFILTIIYFLLSLGNILTGLIKDDLWEFKCWLFKYFRYELLTIYTLTKNTYFLSPVFWKSLSLSLTSLVYSISITICFC